MRKMGFVLPLYDLVRNLAYAFYLVAVIPSYVHNYTTHGGIMQADSVANFVRFAFSIVLKATEPYRTPFARNIKFWTS